MNCCGLHRNKIPTPGDERISSVGLKLAHIQPKIDQNSINIEELDFNDEALNLPDDLALIAFCDYKETSESRAEKLRELKSKILDLPANKRINDSRYK